MKKTYIIFGLILIVILTSCNYKSEKEVPVWSELPEVTDLSSLKNTEFVATLETQIQKDKNIIYAPAFLFAWNSLKNELGAPFKLIEPSSNDFKLLNLSKLYENSLNPDEYDINVNVEDGKVSVSAYFNKTLPFPTKLEKLKEPIVFKDTKVNAFGMKYFDYKYIEFTKVLYYKNDDNFVITFLPKNEHHEIILAKGLDSTRTLLAMLKQMYQLIDTGKSEQTKPNILWKYEITADDIFSVPAIKFNISTKYKNIEYQKFQSGGISYVVETAYQRTGFILNENGAVVESEAIAASLEAAMPEEETIKHPKKLIFDKPFFVVIKRKDQTNPYFTMRVDNVELMEKK
jgi:hypothetical protein